MNREILETLMDLELVDETLTLVPDSAKELCKGFASAWKTECIECIERDNEFWGSSSGNRLLIILSTAVLMRLKKYMPLEQASKAISNLVRVTPKAIEACEEGLSEVLI